MRRRHRLYFHLTPRVRALRLRRAIPYCLLSLVLATAALWYANASLSPALEAFSETGARAHITALLEQAISEVPAETFLRLTQDESQHVTSLSVDPAAVNHYKSEVFAALQRAFNANEVYRISIPFGSLTEVPLLAGKGPRVSVRLVPSGTVSAVLESSFESAGINQTCHRIYLTASAEVAVLLPSHHETYTVSTRVCVSETVIVGEIPQYTITGIRS